MKMRFWQVAIITCIGLILMSHQSIASEKKVHITGIYSDLSFNREGGDLLGTELFIVSAGAHGYVAFVQSWQGGTNIPLVVPVQLDGNKISFTVPAPSLAEGQYNGSISKTGFDGIWRHSLASGSLTEDKVHLKRKKSYWQ